MTAVTFYKRADGSLIGFEMSGHSGYGEEGTDIVCASVSSAAYLTANTLLEILHLKADAKVDDAYMKLTVSETDTEKAQDLLKGLELHLNALADDYTNYLIVNYREV